jgi:hypothetical protein
MSAHLSSFGITFSPNERIIYRDFNNEPTTKERARFVVLQRFYDDGLLKEEIIEDLEPQTQRSTTGFMGMLDAAFKSDPSSKQEPEPQPRLGFLRMLDPAYQKHIMSGSEEVHSHIPCGLAEMLDAAFPHGNRTTPDDRPHVVRGMGFGAMLEAARRGTE